MKASVRISKGIENLFGTRDENIRLLEAGLNVNTQLVDNSLEIEGEAENVARLADQSLKIRTEPNSGNGASVSSAFNHSRMSAQSDTTGTDPKLAG